ncbi:MAG: hypothetical protein BWY93_00033 [Euryarchaeota archaeon ADurb.BinA087]|nr:MAG: hypothetical protein BWY93_00033 [Euryarchaeota archaeon ADurb.BinA087]
MSSTHADPACPYPGWERHIYRLPRPVSMNDIQAFLGDEELYIRDTVSGPVHIIHKYGLLEIHALVGRKSIEVWYNPDKGSYASEYLDALLSTRF